LGNWQQSRGGPLHPWPKRVLFDFDNNPLLLYSLTMASTLSLSTSIANSPPLQFSPIEQELLQEYAKLVSNMNSVKRSPVTRSDSQVSMLISEMAGQPTSRILDSLRSLERKTGLVFTFFKASVYAMVVTCLVRMR
jgi:DASH complex subunit DAD3